ncbi:helix-turn-helix transcriptional regulator [Alcaligenaceae bacterium]|nr:helix-turn-helix transcriptional regulator [Alcaligenaceae bacterium]
MKPKDLLELLMKRAGDNPNSLATKSRVPQPTIFRFLKGTAREPRLSTMEPIARVYGVPVEAFFSEKVGSEVAQSFGADEPITLHSTENLRAERWPFSAPYEMYENLSVEKKRQLDERVSAFLEGATPIAPEKSA